MPSEGISRAGQVEAKYGCTQSCRQHLNFSTLFSKCTVCTVSQTLEIRLQGFLGGNALKHCWSRPKQKVQEIHPSILENICFGLKRGSDCWYTIYGHFKMQLGYCFRPVTLWHDGWPTPAWHYTAWQPWHLLPGRVSCPFCTVWPSGQVSQCARGGPVCQGQVCQEKTIPILFKVRAPLGPRPVF